MPGGGRLGETNSWLTRRRQPIDLLLRIPKGKILGIETSKRTAEEKGWPLRRVRLAIMDRSPNGSHSEASISRAWRYAATRGTAKPLETSDFMEYWTQARPSL